MTAPKRAFHAVITAGGDDLTSLVAELYHLVGEIERGSTQCVTGGCSTGGYIEVTHNPEMTHDRYADEVEAYLRAQKGENLQRDLNQNLKQP